MKAEEGQELTDFKVNLSKNGLAKGMYRFI